MDRLSIKTVSCETDEIRIIYEVFIHVTEDVRIIA